MGGACGTRVLEEKYFSVFWWAHPKERDCLGRLGRREEFIKYKLGNVRRPNNSDKFAL